MDWGSLRAASAASDGLSGMQIHFLQNIATDRGSFMADQIVDVPFLPKGWRAWLETGVIEVVGEPVPEPWATTEAPALPERAVLPRSTRRERRRGSRAQALAE